MVVNARSNKAEADAVVAEIEAAGGKAMAALADVGDAAAVEAMAQSALKRFGRIDILVNNAALRREQPIDRMTYEQWREVMNATLDSAFFGVKACLAAMKKAGGGTIINIGGMSAHIGAKDRAHVITAKTGARRIQPRAGARSCRRPHHRQLRRAGRDRHHAAGLLAQSARIISPTAPSPASAASRTTSPPWSVFCAGPVAAT